MADFPMNCESLHTNDQLFDAQPGDTTRMRHEFQIMVNGGISMTEFNDFQSHSIRRKVDEYGFIQPKASISLEDLKNDFNVVNGVLRIASSNASAGESTSSSSSGGIPLLSWKKIVQTNTSPQRPQFSDNFFESIVIDNGDGGRRNG
ncbi:hypothetical protein POM88_023962 [Heracleum sosnowskyi]|uniref:Uncharacterized protein n=1 Tax=Heracleum sosnowskyi TaxID=360622 RepID=A0AAD8II55_9APIA|nr:hypothetical protein POM88_023962 [Heracleum sosnowskyi]